MTNIPNKTSKWIYYISILNEYSIQVNFFVNLNILRLNIRNITSKWIFNISILNEFTVWGKMTWIIIYWAFKCSTNLPNESVIQIFWCELIILPRNWIFWYFKGVGTPWDGRIEVKMLWVMEHAIVYKYIVKSTFSNNIKSPKSPFFWFFLRGGTPLGRWYRCKNFMSYGACRSEQIYSKIEFFK